MWKDIYGNLDSISINVLHHRRRAERKKFLKVFPEMRDERSACAFKWCMAPHSEEEKDFLFFLVPLSKLRRPLFGVFLSVVFSFFYFSTCHENQMKAVDSQSFRNVPFRDTDKTSVNEDFHTWRRDVKLFNVTNLNTQTDRKASNEKNNDASERHVQWKAWIFLAIVFKK